MKLNIKYKTEVEFSIEILLIIETIMQYIEKSDGNRITLSTISFPLFKTKANDSAIKK
jgi:hypothetical protein